MKKTNSPALFTPAADRFLKRLALLFAFVPPLADTLILFPIMQAVLANYGQGVLYQLLSVISQLLGLCGFFAIVALAVYCVFADAISALGRAFALQGISYLVSAVLLRTLMLWLLAFINDTLRPVFAVSNYTLGYWTDSDGMMLIWAAISLFINVIVMMVLLAVIVAIALFLRRKQKERIPLEGFVGSGDEVYPRFTLCFRIAALIYLVQALANQVYSTVTSVAGLDAAEVIADLASIISPYFLLAIYAFIGYWAMQFAVGRIARRTLALCKVG